MSKSALTSTISKTVMADIQQGRVRMRPKSYFWLMSATSILGIGLASITTTYLCSMFFFWVRIQTAEGMAWGARNKLSEAIASFPWWALVLSPVFIVITIALLRRQGTLYRVRTRTLTTLVVACALVLGLLTTYVSVWQQHQNRPLPNSRPYQELHQSPNPPGWRHR